MQKKQRKPQLISKRQALKRLGIEEPVLVTLAYKGFLHPATLGLDGVLYDAQEVAELARWLRVPKDSPKVR